MKSDSAAARTLVDAPMRLVHCFCYICLVLSVPWSIWISNGWVGLLLYFEVASGGAWLLDRALRQWRPVRKSA